MRVSTSKLTYVVFHMSLLQVAWGLTLVAQVCQKTFDYIIRVHMCFYMPLLQSCLGVTRFGARSSGPEVRGPKFGARLLWHRYAKKTFDYIIIVHVHVLLRAFATKLPGGTLFGARSSGPDSCGIGMPKKHLITSSSFTYMCFYVPLLQSCLGALCSGPEVRGPTLVAQVCQKTFDYIFRIHVHVLLRTCLCYKVVWGHPVRGLKFGARLLWHI